MKMPQIIDLKKNGSSAECLAAIFQAADKQKRKKKINKKKKTRKRINIQVR